MDNIKYTTETIAQYFTNLETGYKDEAITNRFEDLLTKHQSAQMDSIITNAVRLNSFANSPQSSNSDILAFNETLMNYRSDEQRQALFDFKRVNGLMFASNHLPKNKISEYFALATPGAKDDNGSNTLHYCALHGQTDAIEYLAQQNNKSEYFIKNNKGDTPIDFAFNGQSDAPQRAKFIVNNFIDKTNPEHTDMLDEARDKALDNKNEFLAQILTIGASSKNEAEPVVNTGIIASLKSKIESIREAAGFGPNAPSVNNAPKPGQE